MDEKGIQIEDTLWNAKGVPPLLTDDRIEEFVIMCSTTSSDIMYCKSSTKAYIVSKNKMKLEAIGLAAFCLDIRIDKRTMQSCMIIIAFHPKMHVVTSSVPRADAKIVASNST